MSEQTPTETSGEATAQTSAQSSKTAALTSGRGGLIGIKAGMTQVFTADGEALAVTVIDLRPNVITQVKTKAKEGYNAVQIGFLDKNTKSVKKSEQGHLKKSGQTGFYHYQEFRIADEKAMAGLAVGQTLSPSFVKEGDLIDLTSISKGKGFQGVMVRYNFAGGMDSHGASISHRQIGSIGNRADPGKTFKGKKMPGHMGHEQVTIQNVRVVKVDAENGILLVNSSVPGPKGSIVTIRYTAKNLKKPSAKKAE
jgi:large subunit ribosomal protein L3